MFDDKFGKEKPFFNCQAVGCSWEEQLYLWIGMREVSWAVLDVEGVEIGKEMCSQRKC